MQLFKLGNGPWEKLFTGSFQEHEIELYSNPDKILMMLVFEKKLDRVEGVIVELYKVFHATGDVESFTETLPRDVLIVTKHDEKRTMKFLMLGSKPSYVRWTEAEFTKEVDTLVTKLMTSSSMIIDVSKAYELTLAEIKDSSEEVKQAFFTQPMLVPLLSTSSHRGGLASSMKAITKGEIIFGLTRDKKKVVEPLAMFSKTIVNEGEIKDRARVLQIFGESSLLSNNPVIFFDQDKSFAGVGEASKEIPDLQKYQVEIDPLGFPVKNYKPGENIQVDLNLINPPAIAELFGIGDKDFPRILLEALSIGDVSTIDELAEKISKMPQTEEHSEFEIHKTSRILKLIQIIYPNLFGGTNEIKEMMKKGTANIARASIIELDSLDDRSRMLLLHSILKGALDQDDKTVMNIIPQASFFQAKEKQQVISKDIYSILEQLKQKGSSFLLGSKKQIDIDKATREQIEARINVVSGNDVGVQIKNQKAYRVLVRPTLSKHG